MSEWKWDVDQAKGGGVDVLYGIYLIQDDLDRGGWVLRLDPIRGETLEELKALAQRIENVLDPPECPTNCKHGKWGHKFLPDGSGKTGYLSRQEIFRPYKSNFCPDCGADMRGRNEA